MGHSGTLALMEGVEMQRGHGVWGILIFKDRDRRAAG